MVYILLADGFEESEALVPADLLRRAGISVALTALRPGPVTGSHGIGVVSDRTLEELDLTDLEMVVLPGGLRGVENLRADPRVGELVKKVLAADKYVAAICAAPTLLAGLGLLDGRQAVCYPGMEDQMGSAQVLRGSKVVKDLPFITGQAAGASFDFALELIATLTDPSRAKEVAHAIHYSAR